MVDRSPRTGPPGRIPTGRTRSGPLALAACVLLFWALSRSAWAETAPAFDITAAMRHVRALSVDIGVRGGGSDAEKRAGAYVAEQMRGMGYRVTQQSVALPRGRRTLNVVADPSEVAGEASRDLVIGAHIDSKPPSPGANDNATGVATVIEIARALHSVPLPGLRLRYVFFGAEEVVDRNPDHHHFGSRHFLATMSPEERRRLRGVVIIDTTGGGPHFFVGSMRGGPLVRDLVAFTRRAGVPVKTMQDPGWSDHEPFEKAGYPAVYVRWRVDRTLHTRRDDFAHVQAWKVERAGRVVLDWLRTLGREGR